MMVFWTRLNRLMEENRRVIAQLQARSQGQAPHEETTQACEALDRVRKEFARMSTAVHEASHAVAAYDVGHYDIEEVSVVPDARGLRPGYCFATPERDWRKHPRSRLLPGRELICNWVGEIAQAKFSRESARGLGLPENLQSDKEDADLLCSHIRSLYGKGRDAAYEAFCEHTRRYAARIVGECWPVILALANALLDQGTLDGEGAVSTIRSALPRESSQASRERRAEWRQAIRFPGKGQDQSNGTAT
jgi:hypothetical protein